MWVCTGSEIGTTRDHRSSPDVHLAVSLGKCESSLNGGTEVLTAGLLVNTRAEVSRKFCVHSYNGTSFIVFLVGADVVAMRVGARGGA
jgi:hypothetical protein